MVNQLGWYDWSKQNNSFGAWVVWIILSIRYLFTKVNENKKEINKRKNTISNPKKQEDSLEENNALKGSYGH